MKKLFSITLSMFCIVFDATIVGMEQQKIQLIKTQRLDIENKIQQYHLQIEDDKLGIIFKNLSQQSIETQQYFHIVLRAILTDRAIKEYTINMLLEDPVTQHRILDELTDSLERHKNIKYVKKEDKEPDQLIATEQKLLKKRQIELQKIEEWLEQEKTEEDWCTLF